MAKLIDKRKTFQTCKEALDFIDKLEKKKRKQILLHSHPGKKKWKYTWSVTWKGNAKK